MLRPRGAAGSYRPPAASSPGDAQRVLSGGTTECGSRFRVSRAIKRFQMFRSSMTPNPDAPHRAVTRGDKEHRTSSTGFAGRGGESRGRERRLRGTLRRSPGRGGRLRSAPLRSARLRSAPLGSAPFRSAPPGSARLRHAGRTRDPLPGGFAAPGASRSPGTRGTASSGAAAFSLRSALSPAEPPIPFPGSDLIPPPPVTGARVCGAGSATPAARGPSATQQPRCRGVTHGPTCWHQSTGVPEDGLDRDRVFSSYKTRKRHLELRDPRVWARFISPLIPGSAAPTAPFPSERSGARSYIRAGLHQSLQPDELVCQAPVQGTVSSVAALQALLWASRCHARIRRERFAPCPATEPAETSGVFSCQDEILLTPWRDFPVEDVESAPSLEEEKWDFVLVSDIHEVGSEREIKRKKFLDELSKKGFTIKKIEDQKLFYGVRAPKLLFRQYQWLLRNPDSRQQSPDGHHDVAVTTRIRIVNFILQNTVTPELEKLQDLIKKKVFEAAFPLHEKGELSEFLKEKWARWRVIFCRQPIEKIRWYFGEKAALYFAWLGWYTFLLGIAAAAGLLVFVAGITVFNSSQVSKEICEATGTIMCPLCDQQCPFWRLSDTCTYARVTHMIDNEGTVLFAMFMAIWATVFLELWKRQRARVVTDWDLYRWDEEEEELALELINNLQHEPRQYQHSYFRSTIILLLVLVMIAVLVGIAHALVIYRVVATALFTQSSSELLREQADTVAVMTGAVLHYITIVVMSKVNRRVALFLCDLEKPRTFSQRENTFTVKIFTFQFFTNFSSLIYIAFFLGRINGHPGNYVRIAGKWRLEECHPSGCITDLFIQMAIIMLLKQTISNVMEYLNPWIRHQLRRKRLRRPKKRRMMLGEEEEAEDPCKRQWLSNYELNEVNIFSLFDEFLEMVIQYSFTTIFVAAFPLAPLLAFCNNLFEIHLDAIKMMRLHRRMVPRKANDIGIWLLVLEAIGILAVIGNGLVIAITSDFIPVLVYKYTYSPCVTGNSTGVDCSAGYINHSLSTFRVQDFEFHSKLPQLPAGSVTNITECRYRDYRNAEDYGYTVQFWHIFAARLAFLILFEHVALCVKLIAAWFIPDVPLSVKNTFLGRKHSDLRKELSMMEYSTEV
ncbi:anoctamin-9 [Pezoporus flaviventris]|uniref:anoctamin-9 n=1 Tax=Pezoporus flaviventris TaxID=889875 RepID=UPI002AAFF41E|nr:anoctamin-9 [Pezoporus flaviventris]